MSVWTEYERLSLADRSQFAPEWQKLFAILDLRMEVNSQGFRGYFSYPWGDTAPLALTVLPFTLGDDWAGLLAGGMALFGDPYPSDSDVRLRMIRDLDLGSALDELDARHNELEAGIDADARLARFVPRRKPGSPTPRRWFSRRQP